MKKEISDPEKAIRYKIIEERRKKTKDSIKSFCYGFCILLAVIVGVGGIATNPTAAVLIFMAQAILITLLVDWGVITKRG